MKEQMGWPGVLGVVLVVVILGVLALTAMGAWPALAAMAGESLAAWVQAIGSVAALFLTGGLAWWESHRRRLEARGQLADLLHARVAVLNFAYESAASLREVNMVGFEQRGASVGPMGAYEGTKNALKIADRVTVLDMPTKECVEAYFVYTAGANIVRESIALNYPEWMSPYDTLKLGPALRGMSEAVSAIKAEADRLARGGG